MKTVVSISLGPTSFDYDFRSTFLGQRFRIVRVGCDHDFDRAARLVEQWSERADTIGLGQVRPHCSVGTRDFLQPQTKRLERLAGDRPVTTGTRLRAIVQE